MFSEIFSVLAPVLICVGIGYGWAKSGKDFDVDLVTAIVTYFGTPCLIFYALSTVELNFDALFDMGIAALAANAAFIVIGGIFLKIAQLPQRAFLQALSFPNVGNVGMPLCFLAFGQEGLALGVTFFAVYAIFQMSVGAAFVSGVVSIKGIVKMPIVPATIIAAIVLFTKTPVPDWIFNTTKLIGDLTIPLMLFTLGVSLSQIKVKALTTPIIPVCGSSRNGLWCWYRSCCINGADRSGGRGCYFAMCNAGGCFLLSFCSAL